MFLFFRKNVCLCRVQRKKGWKHQWYNVTTTYLPCKGIAQFEIENEFDIYVIYAISLRYVKILIDYVYLRGGAAGLGRLGGLGLLWGRCGVCFVWILTGHPSIVLPPGLWFQPGRHLQIPAPLGANYKNDTDNRVKIIPFYLLLS